MVRKCLYLVTRFEKKTMSDGNDSWFPYLGGISQLADRPAGLKKYAVKSIQQVEVDKTKKHLRKRLGGKLVHHDSYFRNPTESELQNRKAIVLVEAEESIHTQLKNAPDHIFFLGDTQKGVSKNRIKSAEASSFNTVMANKGLKARADTKKTKYEAIRDLVEEIDEEARMHKINV